MLYRWLAVAVVVLHFAYLAYLAAGGFLAWRWPRTFAVHGTVAIWGVVIVATNARCPLTVLQNMLRAQVGNQNWTRPSSTPTCGACCSRPTTR